MLRQSRSSAGARRAPARPPPPGSAAAPLSPSPLHRVLHRGSGGSGGGSGALPRFLPSRQAQRCGFCRTPSPRLLPAGRLPSPRAGALRSRFAGFRTRGTALVPVARHPGSEPPSALLHSRWLRGSVAPIPIPFRHRTRPGAPAPIVWARTPPPPRLPDSRAPSPCAPKPCSQPHPVAQLGGRLE